MRDRVYLFRINYPSYYKYRKDLKEYRDSGYFVARCYGGVICFLREDEFKNWKKQK